MAIPMLDRKKKMESLVGNLYWRSSGGDSLVENRIRNIVFRVFRVAFSIRTCSVVSVVDKIENLFISSSLSLSLLVYGNQSNSCTFSVAAN